MLTETIKMAVLSLSHCEKRKNKELKEKSKRLLILVNKIESLNKAELKSLKEKKSHEK